MASVVDLDDFDPAQFVAARCAVLMLATYGEGEPTDNAAKFVKWLTAEAGDGDGDWPALSFAVFGLGNKQYEHYNSVGKKVGAVSCEACARERLSVCLTD
jgi:NADPH-ferrihemoprotein reductase